jgi:hypothetical protein
LHDFAHFLSLFYSWQQTQADKLILCFISLGRQKQFFALFI